MTTKMQFFLEIDYGSPPSVPHSTYALSIGTFEGSVATYSCNTGYRLDSEQENQLICNASDHWLGTVPRCIGGHGNMEMLNFSGRLKAILGLKKPKAKRGWNEIKWVWPRVCCPGNIDILGFYLCINKN